MLTALIIDDEPLARDELRALIAVDEGIEIVGEAGNAIEAMSAIHRWHPDVIFLDIQMPKINGLELAAMLDPDSMPHIVFVTAFDEFAVRAFEEHAFDYLLKPVEASRLAKHWSGCMSAAAAKYRSLNAGADPTALPRA